MRSCSTAPARNVSQAAISTVKPFSISQKEICVDKKEKGRVGSRVDIEPEPSLHYEHPEHADYIVIIPSSIELN